MTKPTVGRVVHVYTKDVSRHSNGIGEGPYAAMITQVYSDSCINAAVFPPFAPQWDTASCLPDGNPTRWAWPPREPPV